MKSVSFQVPLKPISINNSKEMKVSNWRNPKTGKRKIFPKKTAATESFETMFNYYLRQIGSELTEFAKDYDPCKDCIHLDAYFYINKDAFFTKAISKKDPRVHISKHSLDLDNCLKISIDVVFNFLGIDDKNICYINTQKIPTNSTDSMIFKISYAPFPSLGDFSADHLSDL